MAVSVRDSVPDVQRFKTKNLQWLQRGSLVMLVVTAERVLRQRGAAGVLGKLLASWTGQAHSVLGASHPARLEFVCELLDIPVQTKLRRSTHQTANEYEQHCVTKLLTQIALPHLLCHRFPVIGIRSAHDDCFH